LIFFHQIYFSFGNQLVNIDPKWRAEHDGNFRIFMFAEKN